MSLTEAPATPWIIDFRVDDYNPETGSRHRVATHAKKHVPKTAQASAHRVPATRSVGPPVRSMSPKQIRARARRNQRMLDADLEALYKPIEEWDSEELARGIPRSKNGLFNGTRKPAYVSRAFHEKIVKRFTEVVKMEMREQTVEALVVMKKVMTDDRVDSRGKPIVPASTKLQAAQFLLEHIVGKPTQRTETDISIKLQAILGSAMLNPAQTPAGLPQLTQGYIDAEVVEEASDDEG